MTSEFDAIARIRSRAFARPDVVLGIGDDAAILRVPPGHDLVVAMDTLNDGVHFPGDTDASSIGWKALAVNLSDLAAMGAQPAWCTLSLSLPHADDAWLDAFFDGFLDLARRHDCALVGGDTTRGPLSICVTVHGVVPQGTALRRDGARAGDDVWVTGTLGDAAAALAQWRVAERWRAPRDGDRAPADPSIRDAALQARLDRPTPRVESGVSLRGIASSCIDISDGLAADLGHVLRASGVGADLDPDRLPTSESLRNAFDSATLRRLQLTRGDDYELCFTAPRAHRETCATLATRIGVIETAPGLRLRGTPMPLDHAGWDHFR